MKILLKPIKWILSIIAFILIIPVTLLIFMYSSVTPPTEDSVVPLEEILKSELDNFIDESQTDKTINLGLNSATVNLEIKKQLIAILGENAAEDDDYLYTDGNVMFQGTWVEYGKDTINIISGMHINARIMTYKTKVLLSFKVDEVNKDNQEIVLTLKKINVGHLPLAWAISLSPKVVELVSGKDISQMVNDALGGIGEFDLKERELRIGLNTLIDKAGENKELVNTLVGMLFENDLIRFGVNNEEKQLGLSLNFNKLHDTNVTDYVVSNPITSDEEFKVFLKSKAIESLVMANNKISFDTSEMNRLINYWFSANITDGHLTKTTFYEEYELVIGVPYIEITSKLEIVVPIKVGKGSDHFETGIRVGVEPSKENASDLVLSLNALSIGEITFEKELIESLLNQITTSEMQFTGGAFVISEFFDKFGQEGMTFTDITVSNNKVIFVYEIDGLGDVLNALANNGIAFNIASLALDIQNQVSGGTDISELTTEVTALVDAINELDDVLKNQIFDLITNQIN